VSNDLSGYISGYKVIQLTQSAQSRALRNYRQRLSQRGIARFEVLGLDRDRDLIRALAKRLARNDADAARLRSAVSRTISGDRAAKGGLWAALRRSPLVGAHLDLRRSRGTGRKINL
jgi:hypothetical protein